MVHRYLIVGTGPAGITAAIAIQNQDPTGQLLLIGEDVHGFYSRPGLAYYLTGEIPERELFLQRAAHFQHIKAKAVFLDSQAHRLILENGYSYTYDRLLLATGSRATKLSIPGADLKGVVKLNDLDDARQIIRIAHKGKTGVVVGGGITALEIVEALVSRNVETHYLLRDRRYWHNVLDDVESGIVEKRLRDKGVYLHYTSQLAQIIGKHGKVIGVETGDGTQIKCHLVGVAIGVNPCLELAVRSGLKTDRGILTDTFLQSSVTDVFAAGDVAQVFDPLSGKSVIDMLWGKALAQGYIAGCNMTGMHKPYYKEVPFNVTRLAGLTTTIIGTVGPGKNGDMLSITRGESETWGQFPNVITVQYDFEFNRTRIMVGAKSIVGAVVMGDQTLSRPLHHLISRQVDITPIRSKLLVPDAFLVDTIVEFWMGTSRQHAS